MDQLEELENAISFCPVENFERITQYGYLASLYESVRESPEGIRRLWCIVDKMGRHTDPLVRVILLIQLPKLALVGEVEDVGSCTQWRLILKYLTDGDEKVRKSSQLVLLFFLMKQLIDRDIIEEYFCPAVEQACAMFPDTVDLMGQIAPLVGKKPTEDHFLHRFIALCSHQDSSVRESCVRNFSPVSLAVGHQTSDLLLLPVFVNLCDDISNSVRYACANVFALVACRFTMAKRRKELTSAFLVLLRDNRYYGSNVYESLGAFICTFAEHSVAELLARDRFDYVDSETLSHFQLLKTKNPSEVFSKAYVEELFFSLSTSSSITANLRERKTTDNHFGFFYPVFETDVHLNYCKVAPENNCLLSNNSLCDGLSVDDSKTEEEECNKNCYEEVDEFNSFRFWQISPLNADALMEPKKQPVEWKSNGDTVCAEEYAPRNSCNEVLELRRSLLSSALRPDSDWNVTLKLVDSIQNSISPILTSESGTERPAVCEASESEDRNSGKIVSVPSQDVVPQILLEHFTLVTTPPRGMVFSEGRAEVCATWLPAVASTLGANNWHCIREAHKCLSMNFHLRVRKIMASTLHKLAAILGKEITGRDLVPIFQKFVTDSDDVPISVYENFSEFFKYLIPEKQTLIISYLREILDNFSCHNWRDRMEIAKQLRFCLRFITPCDCFESFVPLVTTFLCDKVASVRQEAIKTMCELIAHIRKESSFLSGLINDLLREFASHSSWRRRQVFVLLCSDLANQNVFESEIFCYFFLEHLIKLSKDVIPNVVLCVARCLSLSVIKSRYICQSSTYFDIIMKVLMELKSYKDRDVKYFASQYVSE